jgi:hypothetical protein
MTPPLAHAGHWLAQIAYLAPLVGIIAHPPPRADLERSRTAWKELYRMVDEGRINFDHHENETS